MNIKRWDNNEVIFSDACENNTICKTVKEAIRQGISLAYANLFNANLSNIDFSGVNLSYANLSWSNLNNCNLSYADLSYANLSWSNLNNCNLTGTDLTETDLNMTNILLEQLIDVKGINDHCPKEGSFIGWKRCDGNDKKCYIVKLEIPEDAKRSLCTGIKCRCDKAKVIEIQNLDGTKADVDEVQSRYNPIFKYKIGEVVEESDFDERYQKEYVSCIYFFMDREKCHIF